MIIKEGKKEAQVSCPFNPAHKVTQDKLLWHITSCPEKARKGHLFKKCPYDDSHYYPINQYEELVKKCPERKEQPKIVEEDLMADLQAAFQKQFGKKNEIEDKKKINEKNKMIPGSNLVEEEISLSDPKKPKRVRNRERKNQNKDLTEISQSVSQQIFEENSRNLLKSNGDFEESEKSEFDWGMDLDNDPPEEKKFNQNDDSTHLEGKNHDSVDISYQSFANQTQFNSYNIPIKHQNFEEKMMTKDFKNLSIDKSRINDTYKELAPRTREPDIELNDDVMDISSLSEISAQTWGGDNSKKGQNKSEFLNQNSLDQSNSSFLESSLMSEVSTQSKKKKKKNK